MSQLHPIDLRQAFVAAYPRYVAGVLQERNVPIDDVVADAIVEGTQVLDGLLRSLDATAPDRQRHSPLELFREALRPVDRAMALIGVPSPSHRGGTEPIVPWDTYELSPGSSQLLGSRAHEAHLAWGIAKARAMTSDASLPSATIRCSGADTATLHEAVRHAGYRLVDDAVVESSLLVIDASLNDSRALIYDAATSGAHVVVFGSNLDDFDTVALKALGAATVVDRDPFLLTVADHLPAVG